MTTTTIGFRILRLSLLTFRVTVYNKRPLVRTIFNMAEQIVDEQKFTGVRLPTTVKPKHYDLTLKPNLTDFTFEGSVKIDYEGSQVQEIVLNAQQLKITEGGIVGSDCPLTKVTYSTTSEAATLAFAKNPPPAGTLELKFTGILNDKLKGFYRTAFKLDDQLVHAATTQFEATDARQCFPCWDEPAIKATFAVTLIYPSVCKTGSSEYPLVALSNMPETKTTTDSQTGLKTSTYSTTPIMSTYLLAVIVGPFEAIEASDGKRPVRVYTTPGKKEQGQFALEVACKSLRYYEDYFNIEYPLPKMDLIAIPDFASGAMENWGLVTYRETCVLVDPKNTATKTKQWVALVVAHELAHQWFGNLVTMEWWTHLWLNEGFASFMEYLCVDKLFPEYDIFSQFVTMSYTRALSLDALRNSHPIEVPVNHPSEIDEIFDIISYEKGSSIIRMLYNYIGDDAFRKGMNQYLTKFAYKNTQTEDLWDNLGAASGKPVRELMSCWTSRKGFPWISVSLTESPSNNGDSVKLSLTQRTFTSDGVMTEDDKNMTWMVPIDVVTSANPSKSVALGLLGERETVMTVENAGNGWIKLNPGSIGFYRTAYPPEMALKLKPAIADKTLPAMDRLGLQNDFHALCEAGHVKTVDLLKLLEAFTSETDYSVWSSVDESVGQLQSILKYTDYLGTYKAYARKLYVEVYQKFGWEPQPGEKHSDAMTRALVIQRLVSLDDDSVILESLRRFQSHLDGKAEIPADLRFAVYRAVAAHGDDKLYEGLFHIHKTQELHEEKNRVLRALGYARDSARIDKSIQFNMSDEVRLQDRVSFFASLGATHTEVAWNFFKAQKDMLRKQYEGGRFLNYFIGYVTKPFASEEKAQEVAKFFEENQYPGCERTIQQSLETIRLNANWLARDKESIKTYLSSL